MRYFCTVLVLLWMALPASAQRASHGARQTSSLGSIGLPLPPIGLPPSPSPSPYNPPWKWDRVQTPSWAQPQTPAWERKGPPPWERGHVSTLPAPIDRHKSRRNPGYYVPPYPYVFMPYTGYMTTQPEAPYEPPYQPPYQPPAPPPPPLPETGRLRLEVEPAALLQIYVDGVYVGTPRDLGGEVELRPGARRIEIRAPGYETLIFDARVEADRTITYRGELTPLFGTAPAAPPAIVTTPAGSKTMYVIPGCYLGNVPPDENRLPPGCDIGRMKTHTP